MNKAPICEFAKSTGIYLVVFLISGIACNKSGVSTNTINYTLDGGSNRLCNESANVREYLGGPDCELVFDRQGHFAFGFYASMLLYIDSSCDLISGNLPYTTSNFSLSISDNNDMLMSPQVSQYFYPDTSRLDSLNGQISHLVLQITYRKNGRIKGNISGEIFGGDYHNPKLKKLNSDFDINIPFR